MKRCDFLLVRKIVHVTKIEPRVVFSSLKGLQFQRWVLYQVNEVSKTWTSLIQSLNEEEKGFE